MTPKGKLIAIGGNEDKGKEPEGGHSTRVFTHKFIEEGILKRVADEIGGPGKRIAVIACACPESVRGDVPSALSSWTLWSASVASAIRVPSALAVKRVTSEGMLIEAAR